MTTAIRHPAARERQMTLGITALLLLLALLLRLPAHAADRSPADLVLIRQGALPIIVTAPHGGREAIPGIEPRSAENTAKLPGSQKWGGVQRGGDTETDVLARGMAAEIARLTGKEPYLVVAKYQRKYVDANRPPELGLDSPRARPYYDHYHRAVRRFVDEIRTTYPAGLLIDVHGQNKDRDVLMRGTMNGRSIVRLLRRAGVDAVTGPGGIYGQLEANGFKIFPANHVPLRGRAEDAGFSGGYTVFSYGSHNHDGIDAVQLEFGSRYRQKTSVNQSATDAGRAVAAFYEAYLRTPASR